MNKRNKDKFDKVRHVDVDKKQWNYLIQKLRLKEVIRLAWNLQFRTRRGVLFLSCLDRGMSVFSAHNVAFSNGIDTVVNCLTDHGWDIESGKLA